MDENKKRMAFMDLALALIVLALFGLAPLSLEERQNSLQPDRSEAVAEVGDYNEPAKTSVGFISSSYQISMETAGQPVPAGGIVAGILDEGKPVSFAEP